MTVFHNLSYVVLHTLCIQYGQVRTKEFVCLNQQNFPTCLLIYYGQYCQMLHSHPAVQKQKCTQSVNIGMLLSTDVP